MEYPTELLKHQGKFKPAELFETERKEWMFPFAEDWLKNYEGDFFFVKSVKASYLEGKKISTSQWAGVLNSARLEAQKLSSTKTEDLIAQTDLLTLDEINLELEHMQLLLKEKKESSLVPTFESLLKDLEREDNEMRLEFEKALQENRQRRQATEKELFNLTKELTEYENKLNALNLSKAEALKRVAAQERIEELRKTLSDLKEDLPWADAIAKYQWEDVQLIVTAFMDEKSGILNANPMGAGKSFEAIASIDLISKLFYQKYERLPLVLWLTKKSLTTTSYKEILHWNPDNKIAIISSKMNAHMRNFSTELAVASNAIVITNYDALNTTSMLRDVVWDVIIMDEVHKLKGGANPGGPTQMWKNTFDLVWTKEKTGYNYSGKEKDQSYEYAQKAKFVLPLTGSPLQNHPRDLWAYLHIFDPVRFPSAKKFENEFAYGYGMKDEDGNPLVSIKWDDLIQKALAGRVITRDKREIDPELPDKTRKFIYVDMEDKPEQEAFYRSLKDNFWAYLDKNKSKSIAIDNLMSQLIYLSEASLLPSMVHMTDKETGETFHSEVHDSVKLDEAMDIITELVNEDEQVVVFSTRFNEPLFELKRRLAAEGVTAVETVTGQDTKDLEPIENRFQQKETKVLLCNLKSAGEGLNLQKNPSRWPGGASNAVFLDLWWNPKSNEQGEDRVWRKGQTEHVVVHIIQAENSVDAFIADILEEKEQMIEGIMSAPEIRSGEAWRDYLEGKI